MGTIELENMEFYAYHGCFAEEQQVGNYFRVDVWVETDCDIPARTDNITDAVNYQVIYDIVKEEMSITSHLLENVVKRIIDRIHSKFPAISGLRVKVAKKNPPLGGKLKSVSVTLSM